VAETDTQIGKIFAALILSPLEGVLEQTKEKVSEALRKNLKDKRLYIFIDDLDRAEPDIIYDSLMLLNEIFDLKRCIFIVALDKGVASKILQNKLNYNEAENFLEKIINWQFQLPEPSNYDWNQLLQKEISFLRKNINAEAVRAIFDYLPKNPRKLKHFLRYLGGLHKSFLNRFARDELDWKMLYMIQLLRLEFPKEFRQIICCDLTIQDLTAGYMKEKIDEKAWRGQQQKQTHEWERKLNERLKSLKESKKNYFIKLYKGIRENTSMFNEQHFKNHLLVLENPELMTWKEYNNFKKKLKKASKQSAKFKLNKFIFDNYQLNKIEVIREFFKMLMRDRDRYLQVVADSDTQKEMKKGLSEVKQIMKISFLLTDINKIFDDNNSIFDINTAIEWFSLLSKWAYFDKSTLYSSIRQQESKLCVKLAKKMSVKASDLLHALNQKMHFSNLFDKDKAFKKTYEKISDILKEAIVGDLVDSFKTIDGIKRVWPNDQYIEEKKLLFRDNKYFHNSKVYTRLARISKKAVHNHIIQKNFIEYTRYLFYSACKGSSWISQSEATKVISKINLLKIIWPAVVAQPLNRRLVGTLENYRDFLQNNILKGKYTLCIPQWWMLLAGNKKQKKKRK
jgi:hypothetical protein